MNLPTKQESVGDIMESVILKGDLAALNPMERVAYYNEVCRSIGLNPLTRPLEFVRLSGRETLYAKRDCADQLRKINGVSISIASAGDIDGMYVVHAKAVDKTGREDEDYGVVAMPDTLKGEGRANAILKAITKAKRRVTLSICGLGFLDETEIEDIPAPAIRRPATPAANPMLAPPQAYAEQVEHLMGNGSGETAAHPLDMKRPSSDESFLLEEWDGRLNAAASDLGSDELKTVWAQVPRNLKPVLKSALENRHKHTALETDARMEQEADAARAEGGE